MGKNASREEQRRAQMSKGEQHRAMERNSAQRRANGSKGEEQRSRETGRDKCQAKANQRRSEEGILTFFCADPNE